MKTKNTLVIILLILFQQNIYSQMDYQNLQKYWNYRDRLRNEFIVVSPNTDEPGTNIPAVDKYINDSKITWGDGNSNMSHYISVLATEYRLLKNNQQDYSVTIHELIYALKAFDRLDLNAEQYYGGNQNLNGFFLRDDVDTAFWTKYKTHFNVNNFSSELIDAPWKEMSQDNVWHLLEGLALVNALVDNEIVDGSPFFFKLYVQAIAGRVITIMQHQQKYYKWWLGGFLSANWYIKNPVTGNFVSEGSGSDLGLEYMGAYGLAEAGNFITGRPQGSFPMHYENSLSNSLAYDYLYNAPPPCFEIPVIPLVLNVTICPDLYGTLSLLSVSGIHNDHSYVELLSSRNNSSINGPYEQFPLLYLALHSHDNLVINQCHSVSYEDEKNYYKGLLDQAPCDGPHDVRNSTYNELWSSTSRLVWPENNGSATNRYFSGLDYMLLFNLYYLIYSDDYRAAISIHSPISTNRAYIISDASITSTNGQVNYLATKKIALIPGFHATSGSTFSAKIVSDPSYDCFDSYSYTLLPPQAASSYCSNNNHQLKAAYNSISSESISYVHNPKSNIHDISELSQINSEISTTRLIIFPNPTPGKFTITLSDKSSQINSVDIADLTGKIVYKNTKIANNSFDIDLSSSSTGDYFIRAIVGNNPFYAKVNIVR